MFKRCYRILTLDICLESDSKEFLDLFDADYRLFRVEPPAGPAAFLTFSIRLSGGEESVAVTCEGRVFPLAGQSRPVGCAFQYLITNLFRQIRDFIIIHGAVVTRNKKALIIAGSPGMGKTTLTLALLDRGFTFFSDDFCPVHLKTGQIHPFPRSLWKRPLSRENISRQFPPSGGRNKVPVFPDTLGVSLGTNPVPGRWLIYLEEKKSPDLPGLLDISLKKGGEVVLKQLKALEGVEIEALGVQNGEWRIHYPRNRGLAQAISRVMDQYQDRIWNAYRPGTPEADFTGKAGLTSMPAHKMAFGLMRDLKNMKAFQEHGGKTGSPASLFTDLCAITARMDCYNMQAGLLDEMVEQVIKITG